MEQARRGLRPRLLRRHQGLLHRLLHRRRPALAQGQRRRLGHLRVLDAAPLHQHPRRPRIRPRQDRRPHPRDLPPDRPLPARRHRLQGPRREHHRPGLRRPPGRRRHPHRRHHRRLRRPRRRRRLGPEEEVHQGRPQAAHRHRRRRQRRHRRRRPAPRPLLRGGRARRDRHERRLHRRRPLRRGPGHRRGRALRPQGTERPPRPRRSAAARTWKPSSWARSNCKRQPPGPARRPGRYGRTVSKPCARPRSVQALRGRTA